MRASAPSTMASDYTFWSVEPGKRVTAALTSPGQPHCHKEKSVFAPPPRSVTAVGTGHILHVGTENGAVINQATYCLYTVSIPGTISVVVVLLFFLMTLLRCNWPTINCTHLTYKSLSCCRCVTHETTTTTRTEHFHPPQSSPCPFLCEEPSTLYFPFHLHKKWLVPIYRWEN